MFRITAGKGFQMTFANGWTVSVQFGSGNYCENRSYMYANKEVIERGESADAEIAAWDKNNNWFEFEHDTVKGRCSSNEVADFIAKVAALPG